MESPDIEALTPEFVINTKPSQQGRSRLVSIVSVGLAVSGVALLVSTTNGKAVNVQNDASSTVSALNVVDRRVTRSGDFERNLAASPTKSPSSGVHKPTWKPSSKPVEHSSKQGAALPRKLAIGSKSGGTTTTTTSTKTAAAAAAAAGTASDGVTLLYYPSETTEVTKVDKTIESNPNGPSSGVKVEEEKVKTVVETTKTIVDTPKVESATPANLPPTPLSEAETEERGKAKDSTDSMTATGGEKSMKASGANVVIDTTPVDLPGTASWEIYVPPVAELPVPEESVGGAKLSKEEKAAQDAEVLANKLAQEEAMAELKAQEKAIAEAEAAAQRAEEEAAKEAERAVKAAEEEAARAAKAEEEAAKAAEAAAKAQAEKEAQAEAQAAKEAAKAEAKAAAEEAAKLEKEALANNVHVQDTEAVVSVAGPPVDEPCPASGCGTGPGTVANPDATPEVLPPKPLTPEEIEAKEIGKPGAPEVEVKVDIAPASSLPVAKQAESDPLHTVEDALSKEVKDEQTTQVPAPKVEEVKQENPEHTKMVSPDELASMLPPPPEGATPKEGTIIVLPDDIVVNEEDTGVAQLRTVSGSVSTKAEKLAAKTSSSSKTDAKTTTKKASTSKTTDSKTTDAKTTDVKKTSDKKTSDKKTSKTEINEEEFVAEVEELETKVKDLKKEVKQQKKSLAKVDTKEEKAEIKTAIEAAEVEIEDTLDKEDKVVTKVVYSQDLDYFKKEAKRTARKAYKKAMERANTALLSKKSDSTGAKGKVDEEAAVETVALMASSGKSSKSSSSSSSKSSSKKSSSKSRRHLDEIFTSSSEIASSSDLSKSNMIAPKAKQPSSSKDAVKEGTAEGQVIDEGLTFGLDTATTEVAKTTTKDAKTSTKTSTKEHQEGEKDIDADATTAAETTNTAAKTVKPSKEGTVDLDALDEPKADKKTDKKTATVVDTKAAFDAESHTPKSVSAVRKLSGIPSKLAGSPTKSPSSGVHKPTWKPSSKPVEHATKQGAALPRQLTQHGVNGMTAKEIKALESNIKDEKKSLSKVDTKDEKKELKKEIKSDKESLESIKLSYDAEVHIPESGKKFLTSHDKDGEDGVDLDTEFLSMEESRTDRKVAKKEKAEAEEALASARPSTTTTATTSSKEELLPPTTTESTDGKGHTKSSDPQAVAKSSGVVAEDKPAYAAITAKVEETKDTKTSSKQVKTLSKDSKTSSSSKHRKLAASPTKSPSSGIHKPTWKPSSKPAEHRQLAGTPTKSPSSGIHKPTWKPSSKPAEHRRLESREERAEQHDTHVAKDGEDIVTYDLAPSSSTGKSSKDILTPPVKGSKLGQVKDEKTTEKSSKTSEKSSKTSEKSSKTDSKDSSSSSKMAKQIKTTDAAVKDLKKMLPIESKDAKLEFKGEIKEVKADIKDEKKTLAKLDTKDEKKDAKKEIKSEVKTLEEIKLAFDAEKTTPASAKGKPVIHDKDGEDGVDLDTEFYAMEENRTDRKVAKKAKAEAEESLASARPSKDSRKLAASPTKSPSSGIHKPTWKPSSKPNEHRYLAASPTKSPSSGIHKPTWKPSSKPAEHRQLAGTPTKSPSSGIHKPTWKPSSKPAEHASKR